jgi:hypothetical protein
MTDPASVPAEVSSSGTVTATVSPEIETVSPMKSSRPGVGLASFACWLQLLPAPVNT